MSAVRENAKLRALEMVSDMLRSQFIKAAGEVAELQLTLTREVAEKGKALAEVETLKARIAEAEALRRAAMLSGDRQMSGVLGDLGGCGQLQNFAGQQVGGLARIVE
jgi:hypothetical protein